MAPANTSETGSKQPRVTYVPNEFFAGLDFKPERTVNFLEFHRLNVKETLWSRRFIDFARWEPLF